MRIVMNAYCNHGNKERKLNVLYIFSYLVDIPGLLEACRGYDTPMGNPHPGKGYDDPGAISL